MSKESNEVRAAVTLALKKALEGNVGNKLTYELASGMLQTVLNSMPAETPTETSVEKPAETSVEKPAETSVEKLIGKLESGDNRRARLSRANTKGKKKS